MSAILISFFTASSGGTPLTLLVEDADGKELTVIGEMIGGSTTAAPIGRAALSPLIKSAFDGSAMTLLRFCASNLRLKSSGDTSPLPSRVGSHNHTDPLWDRFVLNVFSGNVPMATFTRAYRVAVALEDLA
jgi:hypothetical protein